MKHLLLRAAPLTLVSLGLVACGPSTVEPQSDGLDRLNMFSASERMEQDSIAVTDGFMDVQGKTAAASPMRESGQTEPTDGAGTFLAYRYGYGIELPASAVKTTMESQMQACQDAGPRLCQVMGSSASARSKTNVNAQLSLRAEPKWLEGFTTDMRETVTSADGRVTSATTNVEDLTRSILDTDARLSAQKTLRLRLEKLLETRDAKLPDLLALERELARVQGQIESATATLKALRARVSMSTVDINYSSEPVAVSRSAFSPIGYALKDFARTVSEGISGVIYFVAVLLPWFILIILPLVWLVLFLRRRKRKTRKPAA